MTPALGPTAPAERPPSAGQSERAHSADQPADARSGARPLLSLWKGPLYALQFLTIAPALRHRPPAAPDFGAAEAFFPVVGLGLGAVLVAADAVLDPVLVPAVRDVLLVALLAVMTGALHLDGVVDTFDGLFGGRDRAARLAVMRDPRAGTYGVVAVCCLLLLKVAALGALTGQPRAVALLIGPCIGRWAIVQSTWALPYARPSGLGRAFKDGIRTHHAVLAGTLTLGASYGLAGITGLGLVLAATAIVSILGRAIAGRLGGLTGDTYGALCELTEVGVWVALGAGALRAAG